MNDEQIRLARHALGLRRWSKRAYRNRFWCGIWSTHYDEWMRMAADGLAEIGNAGAGQVCFKLTRKGAEMALQPGERLCPEDFPPPT